MSVLSGLARFVRRGGVKAPPVGWRALQGTGCTSAQLEREGGPLVLVKGRRPYVWDEQGRRYIDGLSGQFAVSIGYGRTAVVRAVARQLRQLTYAPLDWRAHPPAIELADKLLALAPGMKKVFFCSGGSEAVDTAIKLARLAGSRSSANKKTILYRQGSCHGATLGATSVTGLADLREPFGPLLGGVHQVCQPDCRRCPLNLAYPECNAACAHEIEEAILGEGPDKVAALIAEPIAVGTRVVAPPPEYWPAVRELCDRHRVLWIADEVLTGIGRTGRWLACEHWNVQPDLIVLAKGLSGGFAPLGAVLIGEKVAAALEDVLFQHGYTFGGHPAACAAALEVLRMIESDKLLERAQASGRVLGAELAKAAQAAPFASVQGFGMLWSVLADLQNGRREALAKRLREKGLLCMVEEDGLTLAPPLICKEADVLRIAKIVAEGFEWLKNRAEPGAPEKAG
ncbi:MAG TPA: aspartate aminotransferase family protein [Elusimicrobia bacterium]|nr:aspartate aminotransferase family protein [Elusimicrobiota bacterium]